MSDEDVRALFRRVDDGPPLGIDVHEVVAGGRRIRARRTRLAAAGSALAVVAAAVLVGLSVSGGEVPSPEIVRPADPPTPTSTVPGPPGNPVPPQDLPHSDPPPSAPRNNPPPATPGVGDAPPRGSG